MQSAVAAASVQLRTSRTTQYYTLFTFLEMWNRDRGRRRGLFYMWQITTRIRDPRETCFVFPDLSAFHLLSRELILVTCCYRYKFHDRSWQQSHRNRHLRPSLLIKVVMVSGRVDGIELLSPPQTGVSSMLATSVDNQMLAASSQLLASSEARLAPTTGADVLGPARHKSALNRCYRPTPREGGGGASCNLRCILRSLMLVIRLNRIAAEEYELPGRCLGTRNTNTVVLLVVGPHFFLPLLQ